MIWITIFIAFLIPLVFLLLRGANRGNNPVHQTGNLNQSQNSENSQIKVNKYTALKTFLEKSFAKKREQKTKFLFIFFLFFTKIIF